MDFYQIKERSAKDGLLEVYPDFKVCRSKDLMVRGKAFYAIWDDEHQMWSTDEYDVQRLVDAELYIRCKELKERAEGIVVGKYMSNFSSRSWAQFKAYLATISDNAHQLDEQLTFQNSEVRKNDYVSKRLSYSLLPGECPAYSEIMATLYDSAERAKLEWAIGSIVAGDSKHIQKFIVLYGEAGAGKSTVLNIIQKLFDGYYTTFEAKALTSASNAFATEVFKSNPLVAIQHDGDLSRIEDNTKLNSIVSHEEMTMNEKYKACYMARVNCFLFMATNRPVKITDAKSGIIRRLIDVHPTGNKIPGKRYHSLMAQLDFELGAIASHCLEVYQKMGKNYYASYRPLDMILQTDVFFNFVEANYHIFREQNGVTLSQAYEIYKQYCDEALVDFKLPRHKFREELKNYFREFFDVTRLDGKQVRSYYSDFLFDKFSSVNETIVETPNSLTMEYTESVLDEVYSSCKAQYASDTEQPQYKWAGITTTLADLDTTKLHYVQPPSNHIVIDFDLKDDAGKKSTPKNIEAASNWPATYAEFSKGGNGVHLHYIYDGDVTRLKTLYSEDIEIKTFTGNSSLRRKVSKCNNLPIATIKDGLPLKGAKKMINADAVQSEKGLRDLITRNLRKEIHPGTKPSIDFIFKILDDAYKSGLHYDVTDMRSKVLTFAMKSTNQAEYCIKLVSKMQFASEESSPAVESPEEAPLVFYDVEVFPNLFIINWKKRGEKETIVRMINPTAVDVGNLFSLKLIGFNCRRYDNHILYARYIGYNNQELFNLSQKIIAGERDALFKEAYNISYTDIYDFASIKQSLKKWEIQLGMHHQELGLPWNEPVPEELWEKVAEYCDNDVLASEGTFDHLTGDWMARQILAALSGLSLNDTTQQHTAKIIFGNDPNPQRKFVYPDLSLDFPGYVYDCGKSTYRGEETGEGGYVYAEPGMYGNVALLDIASMHPTSLECLNLFGEYTPRFSALKQARLAIKHKEYDVAATLFDGALAPYLGNEEDSAALSYALKIAINIVYGLTSAKFPNKFKDPRNVDNVVAKRGALFMIDLKHAVQEQGFVVAHIKTDSIKIPDATPEIIQFVMDFGKKYGYTFEHEATYDRMCLVNNAVYIARYKDGKKAGQWTPTGAQFAQPYVFKTLFSKEELIFSDLCETQATTSALYLDMNEELQDEEHDYHFIGKVGQFCPILPGYNGGLLVREKDGKYYAATGTTGYRWLESEVVTEFHREDDIDVGYFEHKVEEAKTAIEQYGDFDWFVSEEPYIRGHNGIYPF